jgi:hypothetical protein
MTLPRRSFLKCLGPAALSHLLLTPERVLAQSVSKLRRLVVIYSDHNPTIHGRSPSHYTAPWGGGTIPDWVTDKEATLRSGAIPSDPSRIGCEFDQPFFRSAEGAALLRETMIVNGLLATRMDYGHFRQSFGVSGSNLENQGATSFDVLVSGFLGQTIGQHLRFGDGPIPSVDRNQQRLRGMGCAREVYDNFFRGGAAFPNNGGNQPQPQETSRTKALRAVLTGLSNDRAGFQRSASFSAGEKRLIEQYLDSAAELEKTIQKPMQPVASRVCLPSQPDNSCYDNTNGTSVLVNYLKAAFSCNLTKVATISVGESNREINSALQATGAGSDPHNRGYHPGPSEPRFKALYQAHTLVAAKIAASLATMEDLDGKNMLSTSLVVHVWEHALGGEPYSSDNSHQYYDYSVLTFGGSEVFNTGRLYDSMTPNRVPVGVGAHCINQLLITFMKGFGLTANDWRLNNTTGFGYYGSDPRLERGSRRATALGVDPSTREVSIPGVLKGSI